MDQSLFKFDLIAEDPTTHARAGVLHTPHGDIETPIFMPVGTKANVKGIPTETVKQLGAQIVLANTYHLSMRPGEDTIAELGGLHKFMNWHGPILTDSGGFQVFSHNDAVKLTDEGVRFIVNDYDGRHVFWTPEDNMEIAMKLGSDICMQLDQCPGYPATRAYVERAVELSSMWAERCYKAHTRDDQALFGIVQGGMHLDLRLRSLRRLEEMELKRERDKLDRMIRSYILQREELANVFVLIDIRHEQQKLDREFVDWLGASNIPFSIIFTKADKLSRTQQARQAAAIKKQLNVPAENVIITSSQTGTGIDELKKRIAEACL